MLWLFFACPPDLAEQPPLVEEPEVVLPPPHASTAILLARDRQLLDSIQLPPLDSAPEIPEAVAVTGWSKKATTGDVDIFEAPYIYRVSLQAERPDDVVVLRNGNPVPHDKEVRPNTWSSNGKQLWLRLPRGTSPQDVRVKHPSARQKALRRRLSTSGIEPLDFIYRSLRLKGMRRWGLYLPAPARADFDLRIPAGAKLRLGLGLLHPVLRTQPTSGSAKAVVQIKEQGSEKWEILSKTPLGLGDWKRGTLDLEKWANKAVTIRFLAHPDGDATGDAIFVDEPLVYVPQENPKRVVVVMVDTLRPDHVGFYGATRDTTPGLDAWAQGAQIMTNARAAAPWTLPSVRMALTGRSPERWDDGPTLPEAMARAGFETHGVVTNAYLSDSFGGAEVFSSHVYVTRGSAEQVIAQGRKLLDMSPDRDAFLYLHFMDVHLPYREPEAYRYKYVVSDPPKWETLEKRDDYMRVAKSGQPQWEQWVTDRYDQNLRYLSDQLTPFLEELGDEALVVIASDHGEELWDHGGFEHGHTLYDELTRVVLAVKGPNVVPGTTDTAVSLADLTPTMLAWLGQPWEEGEIGVPFTSALLGAPHQRGPVPQGYVLFGEDQWGFVAQGHKHLMGRASAESFDLTQDSTEQNPLPLDPTVFRQGLQAAWKRDAAEAVRLVVSPFTPRRPGEMTITVPGGVKQAWAGLEGPDLALAVPETQGDNIAVARTETHLFPAEVFFIPRDWERLSEITLAYDADGRHWTITPDAIPSGVGEGFALPQHQQVRMDWTIVPAPPGGDMMPIDTAMQEELRALGYIE